MRLESEVRRPQLSALVFLPPSIQFILFSLFSSSLPFSLQLLFSFFNSFPLPSFCLFWIHLSIWRMAHAPSFSSYSMGSFSCQSPKLVLLTMLQSYHVTLGLLLLVFNQAQGAVMCYGLRTN